MSTVSQPVSATVRRAPSGRLAVEVEQVPLGEAAHLAEAVQMLCAHAMSAQQVLVVAVTSGAGKRYMTVDRAGVVTPTAAPAPRSVPVRGEVDLTPRTSLGSSRDADENATRWVNSYILDPAAAQAAAPAPGPAAEPRSRRRFLRRRT